jgi:uncharacterized protein (DUF1778 family)
MSRRRPCVGRDAQLRCPTTGARVVRSGADPARQRGPACDGGGVDRTPTLRQGYRLSSGCPRKSRILGGTDRYRTSRAPAVTISDLHVSGLGGTAWDSWTRRSSPPSGTERSRGFGVPGVLLIGCGVGHHGGTSVGDDAAGLGSRESGSLDNPLSYCHCEYMSPNVKDERLQIRVNPDEKRLLERAAEASHLSVSAFVVAAAAERAESLLAERQIISLSPAAAEAFSVALSQPGRVNARLAAALGRRRGFRFVD